MPVKKVTAPKADAKKAPRKITASDRRLDLVLENPMVEVEPGESHMKLEETIRPAYVEGLVEVKVHGTHLTLLSLADLEKTPTLEQRVAMAKRLIEVSPFLPKYIRRAQLKSSPAFDPSDVAVSRDLATHFEKENKKREERQHATTASAPARSARTPKAPKEPKGEPIPGGVPLKKVCSEADIDPRDARRILRSKKVEKPGGRWEWTKERAAEIVALLKVEKANL